jgi:hypothetical protein
VEPIGRKRKKRQSSNSKVHRIALAPLGAAD